MKTFYFLINSVIAQGIILGVTHSARDMFLTMFYAACICLLIWDLIWGIVYLATPKQRRNSRSYRFLFSIATAWLVPIAIFIFLIFVPQPTLQSLLHFR
jgi:hypothetical protein